MNQFEKALQKDILTYLGYLEEYNNYTQKIVQRIVEEHEIEEWQFEDCKPNNEQNFEYKRMRIAIEKATFRQEIYYSINLGELNITQENWENDYFDSDKRAVCEENNNLVYCSHCSSSIFPNYYHIGTPIYMKRFPDRGIRQTDNCQDNSEFDINTYQIPCWLYTTVEALQERYLFSVDEEYADDCSFELKEIVTQIDPPEGDVLDFSFSCTYDDDDDDECDDDDEYDNEQDEYERREFKVFIKDTNMDRKYINYVVFPQLMCLLSGGALFPDALRANFEKDIHEYCQNIFSGTEKQFNVEESSNFLSGLKKKILNEDFLMEMITNPNEDAYYPVTAMCSNTEALKASTWKDYNRKAMESNLAYANPYCKNDKKKTISSIFYKHYTIKSEFLQSILELLNEGNNYNLASLALTLAERYDTNNREHLKVLYDFKQNYELSFLEVERLRREEKERAQRLLEEQIQKSLDERLISLREKEEKEKEDWERELSWRRCDSCAYRRDCEVSYQTINCGSYVPEQRR